MASQPDVSWPQIVTFATAPRVDVRCCFPRSLVIYCKVLRSHILGRGGLLKDPVRSFVGAAAAVVLDVDVFVVVIAADYVACTYLLRIKRKE